MSKKSALVLATAVIALAGCSVTTGEQVVQSASDTPAAQDAMMAGFVDPPQSARPRTWWHWMNGNVTQEGIARDLDWMSRIGLGGFQNFDASLQTPQIVDERLVYMTPEWQEAFRFAANEADRLDLEMAIAASPGWSETGGPWVPPEDGMKKLVWGETVLPGGVAFHGLLNAAPDVTGPFLDSPFEEELPGVEAGDDHAERQASGRIAVIAVPMTAAPLPQPELTLADGTTVDADPITDASTATALPFPLAEDLSGSLTATYGEAVTVRSAKVFMPGLERPFRPVPIAAALEAQIDGNWQQVADIPISGIPTSVGFDPVTADAFRLVLSDNHSPGGGSLDEPAPGAENFDIFALGDLSTTPLADFQLSAEPRLDLFEHKAGFDTLPDYYAAIDHSASVVGVDPAQVIDLTDHVSADGTLDWTPPAGGHWRVLSFGWSLTGKTNHPATPEATGLEVDKLDPVAVRSYLETYIGMYRDTLGEDMIGERGLQALLTDSIEVGASNWTPRMEAEFEARRGYALRPWLPALAGVVIGSPQQTEAFLYDWRETLAEMLADYHYGTVAEVAHENGLIVYGEALENGRPMLGDDLAMRSHADIPMAAMWTWFRGSDPRWSLLGDMKGAASVAHVYGQNLVAAESMTSANSPWAFAPRDLKRVIDFEFAYGINRPVIHTSVHVPVEDRAPGLSLMIFGQYFNRNETWAEMARPWIDYIARSSYLLQQGHYAADVAVFMGEEAPLTAQYIGGPPAGLPTSYGFDFVNADMLADAITLDGNELVTLGGTRYRAIQLNGSSAMMTLPTLERIAEIARAGVLVVGDKPQGSPSLADDAAAFAALADATWALSNVSADAEIEAMLAANGIAPDFAFTGGLADSEILFLHRQANDAEIYFVNNRRNRAEQLELRFRVTGHAPELLDAITGTSRPLSYRVEDGVTVVPLEMGPEDAKFVVFREATDALSRTVASTSAAPAATIAGPWTVTFQEGRGAPAGISMATLAPLNEHADDGVRYFSGTAIYTTSFEVSADTLASATLSLDLGHVADVAEVFINGQPAGITWFAPDRVNVAGLLQPGTNELEVRVANRWINRLIGDRQEGMEPVTFTAAPTYYPDAELRPSGLIGPVQLLISE